MRATETYQMKKEKHKPQNIPAKNYQAHLLHLLMARYYAALGFILLLVFFSYLPALHNGFLNWDDNIYIQTNPFISSIHLREFFSKPYFGNYHPLTMLVYAVQYHFFGFRARGYHAVNLAFHLFNVILVFYAILLLSKKNEIALVASLLFGIHPIHVESVAWASELKDVLCTFFFLASYIFYLKYIKSHSKEVLYFFSAIIFLSLLSKAMAVSLPLVLLLTDYFFRKDSRCEKKN